MNKSVDHLVTGLVAAILTSVIAGVVIWQITATQHDFVAGLFAAQNAKIQAVGDALAKTTGDLKQLDGALKTTEATLREVKDQVSLTGTRGGIAKISTLVENANKTLAEVKHATIPDQAKAALAPLAEKLDAANKTLTGLQTKVDDKTRDQALARIETTLADVKDAIGKQPANPNLKQANAKLDDALKTLASISKATNALKSSGSDTAKLGAASQSLSAISQTLDAIKAGVGVNASKLADASKSLDALGTSVKQGFADLTSTQSDAMKAAATKRAPTPQPAAKPETDLVVFYVSMATKTAAAVPAPVAAPGLTPAVPPPFTVHFERLGRVDDEGQTALIIDKLRGIVKGHSGCAIAVAGYTDTFGGDRRNYELSKRRANEVADKLKAAFKPQSIPVTETPWGERRLKEWTPDGVARAANRRVDVRVSCEK